MHNEVYNEALRMIGSDTLPEKGLLVLDIGAFFPYHNQNVCKIEAFLADHIEDIDTDKKFDLTFTSGVLIHINPDELQTVYKKLYDYSQRYVMVSEYYNPTPVEVNYRGNKGRLFKRDFAGEMMDMFPDLHLVDYGFIYHRDWRFPEDDSTWFLMEKR